MDATQLSFGFFFSIDVEFCDHLVPWLQDVLTEESWRGMK
jgi:hypothetical protein